MSEHYQVIAVKAEVPNVRAALDGFAQSLGGRAHTVSNAAYMGRWDVMTFFLFTHGEWVVLEAELGLIPVLAIYLSQATQADVVCRWETWGSDDPPEECVRLDLPARAPGVCLAITRASELLMCVEGEAGWRS